MDSNELLILGMLRQSEQHVYRILSFVEEGHQTLSDLKKATAYRLLERLYDRGLVTREFERETRYPERMIYRLTEAGEERFWALLREQLVDLEGPLSSGNSALAFINQLTPTEGADLLEERRVKAELRRSQISSYLATSRPEVLSQLAFERELVHVQAELDWLDQTIETLRQSVESPRPVE